MSSWSRGTSVSQSGSGPAWFSTGNIIDSDVNTFTYVNFNASGTSQTLQVTGFNSLDPFSGTTAPYWRLRFNRSGTATATLYTRLRIDGFTGNWQSSPLLASIQLVSFFEQTISSSDWRNAIIDIYVVADGLVQANVYDLILNLLIRTPFSTRNANAVRRESVFEAALGRPPHARSKKVPVLGPPPRRLIPSRAVIWREQPPEETTW